MCVSHDVLSDDSPNEINKVNYKPNLTNTFFAYENRRSIIQLLFMNIISVIDWLLVAELPVALEKYR
jgi:hypothetical protein